MLRSVSNWDLTSLRPSVCKYVSRVYTFSVSLNLWECIYKFISTSSTYIYYKCIYHKYICLCYKYIHYKCINYENIKYTYIYHEYIYYIGGLLSQAPGIDMKCNFITGMGAVARSPFASAIYHHRWTRLALARLLIPFISRSCHRIDYGDEFTSRCRKFENRVTSRISRIARSQLIAHKW